MLKGMTSQRLIALSLTGITFLNFPLLALFLVWGILIAALAWVMEKQETT